MGDTTSIEQELARRGNCFLQTTGQSMEPILHEHYSTVVVEPLNGSPKRDDMVLYHLPGGPYVIHRVRKVRQSDCIIRGDNCIDSETIPHEWLVGVVTGFYDGESYISCVDPTYQRYVKTVDLRWQYRRCRVVLSRIWHKLIR